MAVDTPHAGQTKLTLASKLAIAGLCAFGALLVSLACAGSALASRGHEFTSTFGTPCVLEPCTGESLKKPNGVAVNEATGDVYVVDEGANRVARFDKEGAFLSEFNGSGLHGEGKAAGSGEVPGEVPTGEFSKPETIAVDNSCVLLKLSGSACTTADPSNGDVYVVDAGHKVVDKYTTEGEYVGQIAAGEEGRFTEPLDGVAVDTSGGVWVFQEPLTTPGISGFTNGIPNQFAKATPPPNLPGFAAPGIAVDANGDFYVRNLVEGLARISKVAPTGEVIVKELDKEESSAVAVDQTNNNALVDNLTSIGVFNSEGSELERLGKEKGEEHLTAGAGVGVDAATSTIYVADSTAAQVVVFGPQEASAPSIESESFSEVTSASASVGAEINPRSEPGDAATKYRFQYEACPTRDPSSCPGTGYVEVPGSAGELAADFEGHAVSATLLGLQPNTTYRFRALAENAHDPNNPVGGQGRSFTTQVPGGELALPDNRGFELVSPPDKQGAQIEPISETGVVQAAAAGSGITYLSNAPTEAEPEGVDNLSQNISTRGSASWSSRDITLPHTSATGSAFHGQEYRFFNPELTQSAVEPFGEFNRLLSVEASESTSYLRDLSGSCGSTCFRPLVTGKPGFSNVPEGTQFGEDENCKPKVTGSGASEVFCGPQFLGASVDLSHVVLKTKQVALTPGGPTNGGLYEWSAGALLPVSVLPGSPGAPTEGEVGFGIANSQAARGAISNDGARIDWTNAGNLYQRDMANKETVQLDRAEEPEGTPCSGCVSGGGTFQFASSDGSRVFFTDENKLTGDSGTVLETKADLYECKIDLTPKLSCDLTDLTPKNGEEGAGVLGSVLGASEDGEYLYFVAKGVQSGANGEGKSPISGKPNLYLRHGASTSFIATLSGGDETDWDELKGTPASLSRQPTRVTPSGQYLELMSQAEPTGYDNHERATGKPTAEVYLFNAATAKLSCASCDPTGERPDGVEYLKLEPGKGGLVGGPRDIWPANALVAANVPGWTGMSLSESRYQPRYLNNQGRLFFNTVNPLVAQDSNGTQDVYEYEPPGIKGPEGNVLCSEAAETYSPRSGGCVSLISSGKSTRESAFLDASESGDDVFFLTQARLSSIDTDNALDVYDAHVCTTALPCITYPPPPPAPCSGESSCKAPISPQQIFGAPASSTFQGPGNLPPAPPVKPKPKSAEEVRIEKLSKALKSCRAKQKKAKRTACEKSARKRYAKPKAKSKAKAKAKAKKSRHSSKGRGK